MDFPPWAKNYIRGEFNRGMRVLIEIESIADANQMLTKEFLKEYTKELTYEFA